MGKNVTQKLIEGHLIDGQMIPEREIGIAIDQTLTQDATGTLVMLELEAMHLDRVKTEISVQYVDHNLVQQDHKNADDHVFLQSACARFGIYFSRPGNGISHPVHQERFAKPGRTLLGADSHTPANGAMGMLAIGAGGLEVAMAMAGQPFFVKMPKVRGIELIGELSAWVSAKDVVLELLRLYGVDGGKGYVYEYFGPGLKTLTAMDRHVIANMGTEMGCTTSVFPSDDTVRQYMRLQRRETDWSQLSTDNNATYDDHITLDLSKIEPMVALPSSPGNVKTVSEIAGDCIYQSYVGSSANPGFRDFAIVAEVFKDKPVHPNVSLDVSPSSSQVLDSLIESGHLLSLVRAGARVHQAGCNGCIGMGQAPATQQISLRTVPRNFPGRSGTMEDKVYLVSPETAAASALRGVITDPRSLEMPYPHIIEPAPRRVHLESIIAPLPPEESLTVKLIKGPNIGGLPDFDSMPNELTLPVLLKVGDDVSTDEILPAGTVALPYRSNIQKISEFCFYQLDENYHKRATRLSNLDGHCIVAGENYGQGSSREHAALVPRYLGARAVIAKDFARIHWQNLVNFGVLPLTLDNPDDYDKIDPGNELQIVGIRAALDQKGELRLTVHNNSKNQNYSVTSNISERQKSILCWGGVTNWLNRESRAEDFRSPGSTGREGPEAVGQ